MHHGRHGQDQAGASHGLELLVLSLQLQFTDDHIAIVALSE